MSGEMSTRQQGSGGDDPTLTAEDKAKLERMRKERLDAEFRNQKQTERLERAKERRRLFYALSRMPRKALFTCIIIVIVLLVLIPAVFIPALQIPSQTQYITASSLEKAVDISELSTLDYTYKGIAVKESQLTAGSVEIKRWIDYRVKYLAHIQVTSDMSKIKFEIDDNSKTITVRLPELVMGKPVVDAESIDFLPEHKEADLKEVLSLCREDAAREISEDTQIEARAYENLESIVTALTLPLIGEDYSLEFERDTGVAGKAPLTQSDENNDQTEESKHED